MNKLRMAFTTILISVMAISCADQGDKTGKSTPIDSTNVNGTAPVTYGGDDPANIQDTNRTNVDDTGTDASNVSNNGDPR